MHLRILLSGDHSPRRYHWHHILGMMTAVCDERSAAHERVLRSVATFTGKYKIDPSHGLPHSMPPEELLRSLAAQTLASWNKSRHRALLKKVAEEAEHDIVTHVVRHALKGR